MEEKQPHLLKKQHSCLYLKNSKVTIELVTVELPKIIQDFMYAMIAGINGKNLKPESKNDLLNENI